MHLRKKHETDINEEKRVILNSRGAEVKNKEPERIVHEDINALQSNLVFLLLLQ